MPAFQSSFAHCNICRSICLAFCSYFLLNLKSSKKRHRLTVSLTQCLPPPKKSTYLRTETELQVRHFPICHARRTHLDWMEIKLCQYGDHSKANPSQMQQETKQLTPTLTLCSSPVFWCIWPRRNSQMQRWRILREMAATCPTKIHPFPAEYNQLLTAT